MANLQEAELVNDPQLNAARRRLTGSPTNGWQPNGEAEVARAVALGLDAAQKWLPSWLLYDAAGSALFEQITLLPEYYLTRAEAEIFQRRGDEIVAYAAS